MLLVIFLIAGAGMGLVGLFQLWQRRPAAFELRVGGGLMALVAVLGLTAEQWFDLMGMSRGDGEIFIGYFLISMAGALALVVLIALAGLVALVRPAAAPQSDLPNPNQDSSS